jgi:hypothetical protein
MLTPTQRTKIFNFIPATLGSRTLNKVQARQLSNKESYPLMVISFLTDGIKLDSPIKIRDEQDPDTKIWTEHWGQLNRATVSVRILDTSLDSVQELASLFMQKVWETGAGAFSLSDRILFRGTEQPVFLEPFSDAQERYKVHRASIDLFFRYEFSWAVIKQPMKFFYTEIGSYVDDSHILLIDHASGSYSLDLILA